MEDELILKDKYGDCPSCGVNLDGGDIYEAISKLDVNMNKRPEDILKTIEQGYGYTLDNKKRFTNLVGVATYWRCPNCGHVWDMETGEHFNNLKEARAKKNGELET